jgi:hypothetical protein
LKLYIRIPLHEFGGLSLPKCIEPKITSTDSGKLITFECLSTSELSSITSWKSMLHCYLGSKIDCCMSFLDPETDIRLFSHRLFSHEKYIIIDFERVVKEYFVSNLQSYCALKRECFMVLYHWLSWNGREGGGWSRLARREEVEG